MSDQHKKNLDQQQRDLLKRAENLQLKTEQTPETEESTNDFVSNWVSKIKAENPIKSKILSVFVLCFKQLSRFFNWAAFKHKDGKVLLDENGDTIFSKRRLAIVFASLLVTCFVIHACISALYFYSTKFTETVYVTGKQEIVTGELYQFGGCTSLPCSTANDNGKFYLIESSFYFPRLFYPEQNVFANIPTQSGAACQVEGYGIYFRRLRWLYKSAQLYQKVTSVSCRPYNEQELNLVKQQN